MTRAPVVTAAACTRRLTHATAIHATATHATAIATPGPCPRSEWKHS
jgi:hypothetical protein